MTYSLQVARVFVLGFSAAAGLVVLSLGAHLSTLFSKSDFVLEEFQSFEAFGIAIGAITVFTTCLMLVVDYVRTGAFTSKVVVELVWALILGTLWFAEGVLTARVATSDDLTTCDALFVTILIQLCNEMNAIVGVAFTTWIILHAYAITLLVFALLNRSRGAPVWTSSLKQHPSLVQLPEQDPAPLPAPLLVATPPPPDQDRAEKPQQVQTYDTAPTLRANAPPPGPYGPLAMGFVAYTESTATLGYRGLPQL